LDSRTWLHRNWRLSHIRSRIWTFYIWLEPEFYRASNGTNSTQNSFWVDENRQNNWASRIYHGAVSPSVGPLARVPCWNPLGLRPGDLYAPNFFLFSSHRHIRVWVLLRFNMSSNSATVHRFVRPHLVTKIVWLHLLFLLVFLIALARMNLHGEVIRVTWVITNGAVV
jgi:hypothetical protein